MISFIISQKSVMPERTLRRYLLSSTSPAAASVRLLISTAPLSTSVYSLHAFAADVNLLIHILVFFIHIWIFMNFYPLFGREGELRASDLFLCKSAGHGSASRSWAFSIPVLRIFT